MEVEVIKPGNFESSKHYYDRVLNSNLHPMMKYFLNMSIDRIINRYTHLNPQTDARYLESILKYESKFLPWAGCDLFHVTDSDGRRKMIVIETNSCPSGQKSMPLADEYNEYGGYEVVVKNSFLNFIKTRSKKVKGVLAVFYDKNYMEASGYAATIADMTNEPVYLVPFYRDSYEDFAVVKDGMFYLKHEDLPVRAVFRYVTQKPWNRLPAVSKTQIFNPILGCLAGGRNKTVASKAYDLLNAESSSHGLRINIPQTIQDVTKVEIPMIIQSLGGVGVIKNPYSNAGQGVWTILSDAELKDFMETEVDYDQFIVQSLIGNSEWSSTSNAGKHYHVGTIPNKRNEIFAADIRFMVCSTKDGFRPVGCYARRARTSLARKASDVTSSWDMLGTNLSIKMGQDKWSSDTNRLLLMDSKDFNTLGLSLDQLIEAYVQTVLSVVAIDKMAKNLTTDKGSLKKRLFQSLNKDENLQSELCDVSKNS